MSILSCISCTDFEDVIIGWLLLCVILFHKFFFEKSLLIQFFSYGYTKVSKYKKFTEYKAAFTLSGFVKSD